MRNAPSNSDNIIDSRDIIERFDELESDKTALEEAVEEAQHTLSTPVRTLRCRCGNTGRAGSYPFSTLPGSGSCDDCV